MLDDEVFENLKKVYEGGNTILHRVILELEKYEESDVEELLDAGAEPNVTNDAGQYPLHLAAERGLSKILKLLLAKSADPNVQDPSGRTPLHLACEAYREDKEGDIRFEDGIKFLVHAGAVALEDAVGAMPDAGQEVDFRTSRLLDEAVKKGEGRRKEQRRERQEKASAAFNNKQAEYQSTCSAAMVAVMDSGSHEGYKIMK